MKRAANAWGKLCRARAHVVFALCAATALALPAQTYSTMYSFCSKYGAAPYAGLVQATDGSWYGTTEWGGASNRGTIFKLSPSGALTTLYSFCSQLVNDTCLDGSLPYAGLVQATNGDFYGTTSSGGAHNNCADGPFSSGCGTVFKITPSGTLTTLYSFCSQSGCTDGEYPYARLVQATNGDLYGTTHNGGANDNGTVSKIVPSGTLTTLFGGCSQSPCYWETPVGGLVQATDGDFYGTTYYGGRNYLGGSIFKITPSGTLTTLYSFCTQGGCPDGENPCAGLIEATDGDLYGTTHVGGANDAGTIFKITLDGTLTTLHSFGSQSGDGGFPYAALIQATNGDFYGTAYDDGTDYSGTVFSLYVGLSPFVETLPASGKVGAAVRILGTDLTGVSSVTFNGTPAVVGVSSGPGVVTEITTYVPAGASSGTVQVATLSGTLSSNVPFRVLP